MWKTIFTKGFPPSVTSFPIKNILYFLIDPNSSLLYKNSNLKITIYSSNDFGRHFTSYSFICKELILELTLWNWYLLFQENKYLYTPIPFVFFYDARTRQNGRRTRVRLGDAWAMPLPAHWSHVWVFFLFFFFFNGYASTQLQFTPIQADSYQTKPIRTESGLNGPNRIYWPTAKTGRNRPWILPKQPESALNEAQTS